MMVAGAVCYKAAMAMAQYPAPAAADRINGAWHGRAASDYRFDFWTALGWTLLTCGIFSYYISYQLCRRMRDHNIRRLDLLDAANTQAWDRAVAAGRSEELRPRFERTAGALTVLRQLTTEFRDPAIWLVIILLSGGIGLIILYVLLDQDLVKHSAAEAAVEADLAAIYADLGGRLPGLPPAEPKNKHQYALRVLAVFGTCGLYGYWWLFNLMMEGNRHFDRDWAWEDGFVPVALGGR